MMHPQSVSDPNITYLCLFYRCTLKDKFVLIYILINSFLLIFVFYEFKIE